VLPLTMQLPSHDLIDDKDEDAQKQEKSTWVNTTRSR
jgi:hypothetical protein